MSFDASHSDQLNLLFIPNFTKAFNVYVMVIWLLLLGKTVFFPYFT